MNFSGDCQVNLSSYIAEEAGMQTLYVTKTYSTTLLVVFCTLNIVAAILSFSGNALVFLTVASFSELHITSNVGLASLALANFFAGLTTHGLSAANSVQTLQDGCPPLSGLTRLFAIFLAKASVYSSLLNLGLVTLERYIGVIYSIRYHLFLPERRMVKLIAAVWITSLLLSIPNLAVNAAELSRNIMTVVFSLTLALTFYCNLRIFRDSRRQRRQVMAQAEAIRQIVDANQQRFRGARTMFLILVTLLVCFGPALVVRFLLNASSEATKPTILTLARPWAAAFFGLYSCVSPFVYFFRSQELRRYSKKLLRRGLRLLTFDCYS